jgi:prepilin-type N-terminal cleavage/methylation domain-containing protein
VTTTQASQAADSDPGARGFGLIEIVISMFLLALLAMAFLPVLAQGLKQSAANATLVTATQLVQQSIEGAKSQTTCTAILAATSTVSDARGISVTIARTVGECPLIGYPTTVPVTVAVTRNDTGAVLSTAKTLVFVAVR